MKNLEIHARIKKPRTQFENHEINEKRRNLCENHGNH